MSEGKVLWVDKTGQEWGIKEMGSSHLKNTINFIGRRIDKLQEIMIDVSYALAFSDEYEFHAIPSEEDYERQLSVYVHDLEKVKKEMEKEFVKRIMEDDDE